jgi:hypothetical protein
VDSKGRPRMTENNLIWAIVSIVCFSAMIIVLMTGV